MHRATERADDAGGHAGLKPERVSDRDHQLAHSQIFRICQAHVDKLWRIDANNGEISIGVIARQLSGIFAAVRQVNGDRARVMNNMAVRQNKSIWCDYKPRAVPADFALSTSCADSLLDVDIDYGRRDARDCADDRARIRVEQIRVVRLCATANWL